MLPAFRLSARISSSDSGVVTRISGGILRIASLTLASTSLCNSLTGSGSTPKSGWVKPLILYLCLTLTVKLAMILNSLLLNSRAPCNQGLDIKMVLIVTNYLKNVGVNYINLESP